MGEKEEIIEALNHFPNIKEKFGEGWILKHSKHPLYTHLLKHEINYNELDKLYKQLLKAKKAGEKVIYFVKINAKVKHEAILNHLNKCLLVLERYINKKTIQDLKNPTQFYKTISELEFAEAFYREGYTDLDLNPDIGQGKLDVRINLDNRDVFFEITTPDVYPGLKTNEAVKVPNRATDKFIDEFGQCRNLVGKSPIIIAINITESDITKDEVEDSVKEEIDQIFVLPQKEPIIIGKKKTKSPVFNIDKNSKFISGYIALERKMVNKNYYFFYILEGELNPISSSTFPLTSKEKDIINGVLPKITSH